MSFQKYYTIRKNQPMARVAPNGRILFTRGTRDAFSIHEYAGCYLQYCDTTNRIGIIPVVHLENGAFRLCHGKAETIICAKSFFTHFGILEKFAKQRLKVTQEGKMLILAEGKIKNHLTIKEEEK